jgi:branched-chain amino acid aminotransferase
MEPIDLLVETSFHRAAPGGMGGTKCAGNYSPVLLTQLKAKEQGFADVVYLDAISNTYLEEVSSCNIFVASGKTIKTPPLKGTILPGMRAGISCARIQTNHSVAHCSSTVLLRRAGVTRRSVVTLLQDMGYTVLEEDVSIDEAMAADEVFTTGTAVVVSSVGSITCKGATVCVPLVSQVSKAGKSHQEVQPPNEGFF